MFIYGSGTSRGCPARWSSPVERAISDPSWLKLVRNFKSEDVGGVGRDGGGDGNPLSVELEDVVGQRMSDIPDPAQLLACGGL